MFIISQFARLYLSLSMYMYMYMYMYEYVYVYVYVYMYNLFGYPKDPNTSRILKARDP